MNGALGRAAFAAIMGGNIMDWAWVLLLLFIACLVAIGLIFALLEEADHDLDIWWNEEEPHPDAERIAAFPDRGLDA